jgi:nicotinamide riboside kinase
MRIAISGTQSTGKTTLAGDLAEALPNTRMEPEPFRVLRDQLGLISGADSMTPEQELALIKHSQSRMQALRAGETVIFDRCALDALAHAEVAADAGNPAFTPEWLQRLEEEARIGLSGLTLLVVVPLSAELALEDDGVRSTDQAYQQAVDLKIRSLGAKQPETLEVRGSREERVRQVLDRVDPHGWYHA